MFVVFEILLAFSQNQDWKESFYEVIPPRKVASGESTGDVSDTEVVSQLSTVNDDDQDHDANCSQGETEITVNLGSPVLVQSVTEVSTALTCVKDKEVQ